MKASPKPRLRGRDYFPSGSSVSCHGRRGAFPGQQEPTTTAKMSLFPNKFSAYTMTQLNEILEDDEKLTKMVLEMEEVGESCVFLGFFFASVQPSVS